MSDTPLKEYQIGDRVWIFNRLSHKIDRVPITSKRFDIFPDKTEVCYFVNGDRYNPIYSNDIINPIFENKKEALEKKIADLQYNIPIYRANAQKAIETCARLTKECEDEIKECEAEIAKLAVEKPYNNHE